MSRRTRTRPGLDERDARIYHLLREDASRSTSMISRLTGIPRTTVQERISRMVSSGLIRRFTVIPDHRLLGQGACAFVLVSFLPERGVPQREVAMRVASIEGVHEVHLISGEWDILLKVRGGSLEDIGRLVIDRLRDIPGVGRTVTCACFQTVKEGP